MLQQYFCAVFPPLLSGKLDYQAICAFDCGCLTRVKPLGWHSFCGSGQWEELGCDVR